LTYTLSVAADGEADSSPRGTAERLNANVIRSRQRSNAVWTVPFNRTKVLHPGNSSPFFLLYALLIPHLGPRALNGGMKVSPMS